LPLPPVNIFNSRRSLHGPLISSFGVLNNPATIVEHISSPTSNRSALARQNAVKVAGAVLNTDQHAATLEAIGLGFPFRDDKA
jgi:hypothetical protein